MKQVSIPSPCSEDWSKMSPTAKGAFCTKCSSEVIDFTKKTAEEIRETLVLNSGKKICGHIGKHQLETVNSYFYMWENQSPQVLRSKFLYACILAFGMTLFTGCANHDEDMINGGIENHDVIDGGMEVHDVDTGGIVMDDASCDTLNTGECSFTMELGNMKLEE